MNIGIIIPDRNDRPRFLENCIRMIEAQTLKPTEIFLANQDSGIEPPQKDITWRYRKGYEYFAGRGFDCILFMENDDWYSKYYIEEMVKAWEKHGRPELFGTAYTIYYNIALKKWRNFEHPQRSSAMSTLIKPDLNFKWCPDTEVYTDMWLWLGAGLKGVTFKPANNICMGIKHGVGAVGGEFHNTYLHTFNFDDADLDYLQTNLDSKSFNFYSTYFDK